jgi:hypothetical protein
LRQRPWTLSRRPWSPAPGPLYRTDLHRGAQHPKLVILTDAKGAQKSMRVGSLPTLDRR